MNKLITLLLLMFSLQLHGQVNLKQVRKQSEKVLVYRTTAAWAEKFIVWDSIPINMFLDAPVFDSFPSNAVDVERLPVGNYVLIQVMENDVLARIETVSRLIVYPVNHQQKIQLDVRDADGNFIEKADVYVAGKKAKYNAASRSYWPRQNKIKEALVKVYAPGDTNFVTLEDDESFEVPVWKQRWKNFTYSKFGRSLLWLPNNIKSLFKRRYRYKRYKAEGTGYVLFNQPKYKLTDTVKLKAFILDKKQKPSKEKLDVFLSYYARGKNLLQLLANLAPTSPGAYIYSFPLSDTLVSDIKYTIAFKSKKQKTLLNKTFSTEDYVLDDIGSYNFSSNKTSYYLGDSLRFTATAKDANGNNLLDGQVRLLLLTSTINNYYKDSLYVADTLFNVEKDLVTTGETTFSIPSSALPHADLKIAANAIFKNSNNELQEKKLEIDYKVKSEELDVKLVDDSIVAIFRNNGKEIAAKGSVYITGDLIDKEIEVLYPVKLKIDPLADKYLFKAIHEKDTLKNSTKINSRYSPSLSRISRGDTLGFVLHNPYKIPVNYLVLYGSNVIAEGKSDHPAIKWEKAISNKRKMLQVKWSYMWGGNHQQGQENIGLLYKLLKVDLHHNSTVFPGQQDSVVVEVKDYKGRPAQGVNLSAVAYNAQFKDAIQVQDPPYLATYKSKRLVLRNKYEVDEPGVSSRYSLGKYAHWNKKLSTDTALYYRMLFPSTTPYDVVTPIAEFIPQVSVHVVQKGKPQEIYLLYLNRQLVYYNGVTDAMNYVWPSVQRYAQVGIRLRNKYIQIDSIYLQPFYKHDIVIDVDKLPAKALVEDRPVHYTDAERRLIESSILQLDNNYQTNYGYLWQANKLVKLNGNIRHLVGPFTPMNYVQFFAPGNFDISFIFEPGYEYNLSKQITRLERKPIFPALQKEVPLEHVSKTKWRLGDTLVSPPVIKYEPIKHEPYLKLTHYSSYLQHPSNGKLMFTVKQDTSVNLRYVVLYHPDSGMNNLVLPGHTRQINNIKPGIYSLLLVNKDWSTAHVRVRIAADSTLCIQTHRAVYKPNNSIIKKILTQLDTPIPAPITQPVVEPQKEVLRTYPKGNSNIIGIVKDRKGGNAIPGGAVSLKGISFSIAADMGGNFSIAHIQPGRYTLVISSLGYVHKEVIVETFSNQTTNLVVELEASNMELNEVVVVGYSNKRMKSMTGSVVTTSSEDLSLTFANELQGRAAGVQVRGAPGAADGFIRIRGASSINGAAPPIYVIDGIIYNELPLHIKPEMIGSMEVLKDAAATSIYGARGANGVILIITGVKTQRTAFRDYAFWEPQLFTDADGKAHFTAIYPDNITGWQMFVLAMDKKKRVGKGTSFTRAFKPVAAQLSLPQFLVVGDSVKVVGKALNHTNDDYKIEARFIYNKATAPPSVFDLKAASSVIQQHVVAPATTDTATIGFTVSATTGFNDGEERKLPVFRQGSEETEGIFTVAYRDTTFEYAGKKNGLPISLYLQNNTLDLLLQELDHLKKYPFYCMEQTASKLKGLALEQRIRAALQQPFENQKEMNALLKKLQDAQHYEGGWSWWGSGKPDLNITAYIVQALLPLREQPLVESTIRNGLLYLNNQLPHQHWRNKLSIIATLSNAGHVMDYKTELEKTPYDSLGIHQQWLWVQVMRKQKAGGEKELKRLVSKPQETMTGGMYWGEENYLWYSNHVATTLAAFHTIKNEKEYQHLVPKIIQFFMEHKRGGYWRNTVESASIVDAILPQMLQQNANATAPAQVVVKGDTTLSVNTFPFKTTLPAGGNYQVSRSGGGYTYITLYQKWWNDSAKPATGKFDITTYFEKNGQQVLKLPAGEKIKMVVKVNVRADAEYVMIHIPIPAGCNYSSRKQDQWAVHKEYFKDKLVVFANSLRTGTHTFEIELEPRYSGSFTLNPAKAELMYFPTFFGRNEIRKVKIEDQK
ncbi:carboxypeptidase-like regulatory domain-containing protein [Aridibaculum aurantiacum]|uniref:carboxypeptidase-like regulatory domain-containing protein n=1 Tax=Aridibaculum aurantiacum TaxID=2810307 RepID=UPI001A96164D|nr:carboxypeptidase-like regulatory domain-containing protein [Aridibaculum aurantiacum]